MRLCKATCEHVKAHDGSSVPCGHLRVHFNAQDNNNNLNSALDLLINRYIALRETTKYDVEYSNRDLLNRLQS